MKNYVGCCYKKVIGLHTLYDYIANKPKYSVCCFNIKMLTYFESLCKNVNNNFRQSLLKITNKNEESDKIKNFVWSLYCHMNCDSNLHITLRK